MNSGQIDFTDLVVGSFIAALFVWAWLQLSSNLRFYEAPVHFQFILSILQFGFFFLGGAHLHHDHLFKDRMSRGKRGVEDRLG